ncbi:hypothetical protein F4604DRAFT_15662 [Suillus subluteus]|nr:hypothetical protein F4604DRAFT_15662 [Suillus subluteus]
MSPDSSSDRQLYVCVCSKHNLGQPHQVSKSTWHRHLETATTEQERDRIRSGRALQGHSIPLEPNAEGAAGNSAPAVNSDTVSLPPSARRVAALRDLVKRARDEEGSRRASQDKRTRVGSQDVQEVY